MSGLSASVIAIGDEMTSGARLDTNTQWLCQRLGELGVTVRSTSMVGDELQDNIEVFRQAASRTDIVVSTGGLGPTADDLTREVLAAVANQPLVLHEPSLRHIESLFARRARDMPPRNRVQAMVPAGALDIFNPQGTAPGIDLTIRRGGGGSCRIFALPGVPAEMKEMFSDVVAKRIVAASDGDAVLIRTAVIKCFGLGESEMEARLGDMISRQSSPRVGITVNSATISLRICATGTSETACAAAIELMRREIDTKAGEFVFGEGDDFELPDAVAELLAARNERLSVVELGHAAPLAGWLAVVTPRHVFSQSLTLDSNNTESTATGQQRCQQLNADWVIEVDRYPSLRGGEAAMSDVTVRVFAKATEDSVDKTFRIGGHPSIIQARIGKSALAFFRQHLLSTFHSQAAYL